MTTTYIRIFLAGAGLSAILLLAIGTSELLPDVLIPLTAVALGAAGCCAAFYQALLLLDKRRRAHRRSAAKPAAKPAMLETVEEPAAFTAPPLAPVRTQTVQPPPSIPQRPVQPGDFAEPQGSIFDSQRSVYTDLFGAYRAPNQPNPWDTETPLPPLEPFDDSDKTSPWDDLPVTFDGPLHTGPLLPRRPPAPAEIDLIRSVYAEEGTLNATIRRVYGAKDAKTHGWTKGALEL